MTVHITERGLQYSHWHCHSERIWCVVPLENIQPVYIINVTWITCNSNLVVG